MSVAKDPVPAPQDEARDALALQGLRRMVVHSRDQLVAALPAVPNTDDFGYGKHWRPHLIRRHAAMALAIQVMTLVLECIPGGGAVSEDEAAERVGAMKAEADKLRRKLEASAKELTATVRVRGELEQERDAAVDAQCDAEDNASAWEAALRAVAVLAQTDVPAAMKRLAEELAEVDDPPADSSLIPSDTADDSAGRGTEKP